MLPPSIVVRLAENVRACRAQLDEAEATAGEIRAEYHGYLELLTYAESQSEQVAPALWDSSLEEDRDPAAWCDCAAPTNPVLVHGIDRCLPKEADLMPAAPEPPAAVGPGWCFCGLPGTPGMVHDTERCTFAVALDERPRGLGWRDVADWCECGAPDTSGMVHALTQCVPAKPNLTPALPSLPQPGEKKDYTIRNDTPAWFRGGGSPGAFAPHIPANTGTDVTA